jgi:hypothetical protein
MKNTIIYIEWNDSSATHGWIETDQIDNLPGVAKCKTIGFLVKETKQEIIVARDAAANKHTCPFGDLISIPLPCITHRRNIEIKL